MELVTNVLPIVSSVPPPPLNALPVLKVDFMMVPTLVISVTLKTQSIMLLVAPSVLPPPPEPVPPVKIRPTSY